MIISSKVDLVCWTGRVGLVYRACREALTRGARRVSKRAAIEGATRMPSLQRLAPTIREPMPDPSMTAAELSHPETSSTNFALFLGKKVLRHHQSNDQNRCSEKRANRTPQPRPKCQSQKDDRRA